jgi:hypothetical protein
MVHDDQDPDFCLSRIAQPQHNRATTNSDMHLSPSPAFNLLFRAMADAMNDGPPIQCWACREKELQLTP